MEQDGIQTLLAQAKASSERARLQLIRQVIGHLEKEPHAIRKATLATIAESLQSFSRRQAAERERTASGRWDGEHGMHRLSARQSM